MRIVKENLENCGVEEIVIVVDMINGFVKEGALASPSIMRVVPRQVEILREIMNDPKKGVIFIRDCHDEEAIEFKTFGRHCVDVTPETEVIDELKEFDSIEYKKNSTNFVFAEGFMNDINKLKNLKRVLLMGCLSDICVKNGGITLRNLFDQQNRDVEVCVYEDAIDTFDAPGHERDEVTNSALQDMEANGIVKIKRKVGR